MDGVLNIDKIKGETSFSVVAAVRRLTGERKVGHGGTLDPLATGVLPVFLGRATRMTQFLLDHPKKYRAEMHFGLTSDSGDSDGTISPGGDVSGIDEAAVHSALKRFVGEIRQTPPMFSALKHKGTPLYELARAGITVDRAERTVEIHAIALVSWEKPLATIEVTCSRGTYIRTLAQDLGDALSCGAYLAGLRRTSYGPFEVENSVTLDQFREAVELGDWLRLLYPVDACLAHLPRMVVPDQLADYVRHGRPFSPKDMANDLVPSEEARNHVRHRAYTLDGCFLGVLVFNSEKDEWQPEKVFL